MNVPWDQALDIILKSADLGYRIDGNVLWVAPVSTFDKLAAEKEKAKESEAKTAELVQEIIQINYAQADMISQAITDAKLLSPRGNITKDTRMNTLIIKDTQDSIDKVKELVKVMDVSKPQVMIEAKLVQVSNDYSESLGIRWGGAINSPSFPTPIGGSFSVNTPTDPAGSTVGVPGGALGLTVGHANTLKVDLSLSALESIGKSKTLSNPKILTMDNETATIQQGSTFYISTVSQAGTQTTAQTATLSLQVKPKITPDGYVQLSVTATDNSLVSVNPPVVDTKSMTTQALVKNGETLVLGGIYTTTKTENEDSVPLLGRIPGLGWLFKTKSLVGPTTKELLIFITPTVISQHM
jgi:type IV pilus assembly protein PilQ